MDGSPSLPARRIWGRAFDSSSSGCASGSPARPRLSVSPSSAIGSVGVALVLFAFALNLLGRLGSTSVVYLWLNLIGATIACIASAMIQFYPFVVLEGVWALAALIGLIRLRFVHTDHTSMGSSQGREADTG